MYKKPTWLDINDQLIAQCRGSLEHKMRFRIPKMDLSIFISVMEEVIDMTCANKRYRDNYSDRKEISLKNLTPKDKDSKTPEVITKKVAITD